MSDLPSGSGESSAPAPPPPPGREGRSSIAEFRALYETRPGPEAIRCTHRSASQLGVPAAHRCPEVAVFRFVAEHGQVDELCARCAPAALMLLRRGRQVVVTRIGGG